MKNPDFQGTGQIVLPLTPPRVGGEVPEEGQQKIRCAADF